MRITTLTLALSLVAAGCRTPPSPAPDEPPAEVDVQGATKYPIVLAHGLMAGPELAGFRGVRDALAEDGHIVFEAATNPVDAIDERAKLLAAEIDRILEVTRAQKVNIIAHSMGGLDARYLASRGGYRDRIASITTVSTPHRGSRMADVTRELLGPNALAVMTDVAKTLNAHLFGLPKRADWEGTLRDLSVSEAAAFNEQTPDQPGLYYQSFAGVAVSGDDIPDEVLEVCGAMWPETHDIEAAASHFWLSDTIVNDGPSDGVVTVESAKWGRFRGCIPADHMDEIGFWGNDAEDQRFDHITFYRRVAAELASMGY